jgi:hypothetical protein
MLPTKLDGASIAGVSSFLSAFSLADVSAHATAASENTAIAVTSNQVAGFLRFALVIIKSFELFIDQSTFEL